MRTSNVVACMRRRLGWSLASIFQEFDQYAQPEGGLCDYLFIEQFGYKETVAESGNNSNFDRSHANSVAGEEAIDIVRIRTPSIGAGSQLEFVSNSNNTQ